MTVTTSNDPLLNPDNHVLLLIDHQYLQMLTVRSHDVGDVVNNVTAVAEGARIFNVPTLVTTAFSERQDIVSALKDATADQVPIDRTTLNAWEDPRVTDWVNAKDKRRLVIAGQWTEVCLAMPTLSALAEGYEVYIITDAFLFLNHHGPQVYPPHNNGLPFGPHPHRGFETVTFILEGELTHRDTADHESIIQAGGVQWMTAGSGLVHAEISSPAFKREGGPLELLQLWVNLPARLKMTPPRYVGVQRADMPSLTSVDGRVQVNLISGRRQGIDGPVTSLTGVFMATVMAEAGGAVRFDELAGRDAFLYVARGEIEIGGGRARAFSPVELGEGDKAEIRAVTDTVFVFGHAAPLDEPIVSHGPFVMNSAEEIRQAFDDFRAGRLGAMA